MSSKSELYDQLYDEAKALFKKHNPCKIDAQGRCADPNGFSFNSFGKLEDTGNCCGGDDKTSQFGKCKHNTSKGCRCKSLSCALWSCSYIAKEFPVLKEALTKLRMRAHKAGICFSSGIRAGKVETLRYSRYLIKRC